ncbi:phytanoyl-CoA dioxygenase family protein [Nostoc ellipsosporum NOK]|nr:phytanoyl-CoA dioxygenase family protein [Nostoc ellipsosporum NOK]
MEKGFLIEQGLYSPQEVAVISRLIDEYIGQQQADRQAPVFAMRRFFQQIPAALPLVMKPAIIGQIDRLFGKGYFISKSIYFDKPGSSNWFVSYHQDLSISVISKKETEGYEGWTVKNGFFGVQPPASILSDNITLRLHLDDTDSTNGALRVIPFSHNSGIRRHEQNNPEPEVLCEVMSGGVMWMRPLLFHASSKSLPGSCRRRVIHVEFSRQALAPGIDWAEKTNYN